MLGFGVAHQFPWSYYFIAPLALSLFFFIPAILSAFLVTLVLAVLPPKRTKDLFLISGFTLLVALLLAIRTLFTTSAKIHSFEDMILTLRLISLESHWWSIPTWAALAVTTPLELSWRLFSHPLLSLLGLCIILFGTVLGLLLTLFPRAYDCAQSTVHVLRAQRNFMSLAEDGITLGIPDATALIRKEKFLIVREPAHLFQLLLILGLWGFYLYNLQFLRPIEGLSFDSTQWWMVLFLVLHFVLSHFMCIATINRFAFTTVSLEHEAFWIIQSSPVSITKYLWTKFLFWSLLLVPINTATLAFGASLITPSLPHIVTLGIVGAWIALGITGFAVGMGMKFANFAWEHFAELAASLGSVIFLVCALVWLSVNTIPVAALLWLIQTSPELPLRSLLLMITLLGLINFAFAYLGISLGSSDYLKRRS